MGRLLLYLGKWSVQEIMSLKTSVSLPYEDGVSQCVSSPDLLGERVTLLDSHHPLRCDGIIHVPQTLALTAVLL